MDYRVLAVDELGKLNKKYAKVDAIKSRIVELETKLESSGGGTGGATPDSGGGNKTEHKWMSLISRIEDEKERLREEARAIKRIELAFSSIPEKEARILRAAYVVGRSIDEIARLEHMSTSTAKRLQRRALTSFTRAFYGAVEN